MGERRRSGPSHIDVAWSIVTKARSRYKTVRRPALTWISILNRRVTMKKPVQAADNEADGGAATMPCKGKITRARLQLNGRSTSISGPVWRG